MSISISLDAEVLPKAVRDFAPEWGIVLGSGLGSLVDEVDAIMSLPYEEISGMPVSTVSGHAGRFVFGRLAGRRVRVAQGRVHLYEGRTAEEVTAVVRFMDALGVKKLVLTNAAGSLRADFAPGTWMMLSDHLNLTGTSPLLGGPNFVDMSAVYSPDLRAHFSRLAAEEKVALHEGVYAGLLGPQYETPAEVRMLRALGADAVGMSTVLDRKILSDSISIKLHFIFNFCLHLFIHLPELNNVGALAKKGDLSYNSPHDNFHQFSNFDNTSFGSNSSFFQN